jgi:hypothetical protein
VCIPLGLDLGGFETLFHGDSQWRLVEGTRVATAEIALYGAGMGLPKPSSTARLLYQQARWQALGRSTFTQGYV